MNELPAENTGSWRVRRIDDNGNVFTVQEGLSEAEARQMVVDYENRPHKQTYWAEREPAANCE